MKLCKDCNQNKSDSEFYKDRRGVRSVRCMVCHVVYNKKNRKYVSKKEVLPDGFKRCSMCKELKPNGDFYMRTYDKKATPYCKICCKVIHLNRRFEVVHKISREVYDRMLLEQKGVCKICGILPERNKIEGLSIDHCHKTGKIRGLLCHYCNLGLGNFRDNIDYMRKAIDYLQG